MSNKGKDFSYAWCRLIFAFLIFAAIPFFANIPTSYAAGDLWCCRDSGGQGHCAMSSSYNDGSGGPTGPTGGSPPSGYDSCESFGWVGPGSPLMAQCRTECEGTSSSTSSSGGSSTSSSSGGSSGGGSSSGGASCNVPQSCAGLGDISYDDATSGHCYFKVLAPATWQQAQATCQSKGAYLAVVSSSVETDIIVSRLSTNSSWIGGSDASTEEKWLWTGGELNGSQFWQGLSGGSGVDGMYSNWAPYEPNSAGDEDCVHAYTNGQWNDLACSTPNSFICEKSPPLPMLDCSSLGNNYFNDPATGHCYYKVNSGRNWTDAQASCRANGAYLAVVTSAQENNKILNNLAPNSTFFGGTDAAAEGKWLWTGGDYTSSQFWQGNGSGSRVNGFYTNWEAGEPNNASGTMEQDCTQMYANGRWDDLQCTDALSYMCEKSVPGCGEFGGPTTCVEGTETSEFACESPRNGTMTCTRATHVGGVCGQFGPLTNCNRAKCVCPSGQQWDEIEKRCDPNPGWTGGMCGQVMVQPSTCPTPNPPPNPLPPPFTCNNDERLYTRLMPNGCLQGECEKESGSCCIRIVQTRSKPCDHGRNGQMNSERILNPGAPGYCQTQDELDAVTWTSWNDTACTCPSGTLWDADALRCYNPAEDGVCGAANGTTRSTAPTGGSLCATGAPTAVTGTGPWTWVCQAAAGGDNATCSAAKTVPAKTPTPGICP